MKTKQWFERMIGSPKSLSLGVAVASMALGGQAWAAPASPSTSTWYGTVSTDWNNATNWTPSWQISSSIQPVPGAATTANISSGCPFYPVITGSVSVGSLAIVQGAGSLTVTNGGSLNVGSAGIQISSGASLAIPAGSLTTLGAVTLVGSLTVTNGGSLTIASGGMAASSSSTVNIASGSSLVSTSAVTIGGNFTVNGTMTAPVQVYSSATLTVSTNGVLNTSVGGLNVNSGGGTVNVYGTVNDGTNTVNVNTTLNLPGGTLVAGPITISEARVTLTAANLTCAGFTLYNDAVLNVSGASTVNSTAPWSFNGGQASISGSTFNFSGGTQTIPSGSYSNLSFTGGGTLTLSGGSVSGNFSIATNTVAGLTSGLNIPVGSLTLGSAGEPSGTWGSTNSTAVNKNSTFFTGTGLLTVTNNTSIKSTTTSLAALTTVNYGNSVVWTATVSPAPTGGNVQFQTNGVTVGSPVVLSAGSASLTTSLAAGSYTVTAVYSGTNGFAASTSAAATQTVKPLALTIASGLAANNKVYDGTAVATLTASAVAFNGVLTADSTKVALSTNGYSATFASPSVGTKNVSVQGLVLTGTAAGNYTLTQPTLSATITAAPLTLTGVTAANTNYNGTTVALLSGGSLSGVVNGDNVTYTAGTGSFASKYVGTWAVTATGYTLATTGVSTNYTLTAQPTVPNATIAPASLTLVSGLTANGKVYDGTTTATITSKTWC